MSTEGSYRVHPDCVGKNPCGVSRGMAPWPPRNATVDGPGWDKARFPGRPYLEHHIVQARATFVERSCSKTREEAARMDGGDHARVGKLNNGHLRRGAACLPRLLSAGKRQ